MALDSIYRVTLEQLWPNPETFMRNVFYYKEVSHIPTQGDAAKLADEFEANVEPLIRNIQTANISTIAISVENIVPSADNDYRTYTPGTRAGSIAADPVPAWCVASFRYNRVSTAVRNGQKRFSGVPETVQTAGVITDVPYIALCTTLATRLGLVLGSVGVTSLYQPRIFRVGRPAKTIPAKTIPAMLQNDFDTGGVTFVRQGSQTSRKPA